MRHLNVKFLAALWLVSEPCSAFAQTAALPVGTPVPLVAAHSKLCLTVEGDATANFAVLKQQACTGRAAQTWSLRPSGYPGEVLVVNAATGKCLDNAGPSKLEEGARIIQWDCVPQAPQQRWRTGQNALGTALVSVVSGKCLDVYGGWTAPGADLLQWSCHGGANQSWSASAPSSGTSTGGTATDGTWTRCASEGQTCAVTGTRTLRYGANGVYVQRTVSASTACSYTVFGDPLVGVNKTCELLDGVQADTWQTCASEGQTCTVNAATVVRYGAGDRWYQRTVSAPFSCVYTLFGDPAFGVNKTCQIRTASAYTPASTNTTTSGSGGAGTTGTGTSGSGGTTASGTGAGATTPPGETPPAGKLGIIGRQSGKCVGANGSSSQAGLGMRQYTCNGAEDQNWTFVPAGSGYQIKGAASGLCLTVQDGAIGNGAAVVQQACGTQAGGLWTLRRLDQWYEVVAVHSGRCLNVNLASQSDGAQLIQYDCVSTDNERFTLSPAPLPSLWSSPTNVGLVPLSGAALPSGKLLLWASNAPNQWLGGGGGAATYTTLYDPATGTAKSRYVGQTGHDIVCQGTNLLADGRIVVTGGDDQQQNTSIYDPATDAWSRGPQMNIYHNYHGATTLSGGEAMVFGGSWLNNQGNKFAEVWAPTTGAWRLLRNVNGNAAAQPGVDIATGDSHFWMFAQSNGFVFTAGPPQAMQWIDTRGDGALIAAGKRGDDNFAMNGNAVMYDVGKILKVGGATQYRDGAPTSDAAYTIDITKGPGAAPQVQKVAPLAMARAYSNSVVLPSGEVVVIGGLNNATVFSDTGAVMMPEIWSPATGRFRRLAAMSVPRNYHSIALLMPDGRVVAGGGGLCACGADHPDFQILTPPYLLDAAGKPASRPVITAAPASAALGSTLTVSTDRPAASFALVRMSATTHSVNNDQRRVPLTPASSSGTSYRFQLSADPGVLLPGPWMIFAMDESGVPSVAKVVRIQ